MRITVKQLKQLIREAVEEAMEEKELVGDQDELDVNKDGKLDKKDFKELGRRSKVVARAKKDWYIYHIYQSKVERF